MWSKALKNETPLVINTFAKFFIICTWFLRDTVHGLGKQVAPPWQLPPPKVLVSLLPSLTTPKDLDVDILVLVVMIYLGVLKQ